MNYKNGQIVYGIDKDHTTYGQDLKIVIIDGAPTSFENPLTGEDVEVKINQISRHQPKKLPLI